MPLNLAVPPITTRHSVVLADEGEEWFGGFRKGIRGDDEGPAMQGGGVGVDSPVTPEWGQGGRGGGEAMTRLRI